MDIINDLYERDDAFEKGVLATISSAERIWLVVKICKVINKRVFFIKYIPYAGTLLGLSLLGPAYMMTPTT